MKKILKFLVPLNLLLALVLVSCKANNSDNRKEDDLIEYYDIYNNTSSDEVPFYYFFLNLRYRISSTKASEQKISISYGFPKFSYSSDLNNYRFYISDYTNFNQELELKLYRVVDNNETLLDSYIKPISWFLSDEFYFSFDECKQVYEDTINIEDLNLNSDEHSLYYYCTMKSVDNNYIDLFSLPYPPTNISHDFSVVLTMEEAIEKQRTEKDNDGIYGIKMVEGNQEYLLSRKDSFLCIKEINSLAFRRDVEVLIEDNNIYFKKIDYYC